MRRTAIKVVHENQPLAQVVSAATLTAVNRSIWEHLALRPWMRKFVWQAAVTTMPQQPDEVQP